MALRKIALLAISISQAVSAFRDTSPLFVFSSSEQLDKSFDKPYPQISTSEDISGQLTRLLDRCSHDTVVIVSQPGVDVIDFGSQTTTPHLRRWLGGADNKIRSSIIIPDVVGNLSPDTLSRRLEEKCKSTTTVADITGNGVVINQKKRQTIKIDFQRPEEQSQARVNSLKEYDSFLNSVVSGLEKTKYVVIFTTNPRLQAGDEGYPHEQNSYEMDDLFPSSVHTELRRDLDEHESEDNYDLPLFEKYQFLSPGLFMGLTIVFPLLIILYVGVYAVSSVEVSYFAFSKEMGPSAQKKQ